MSGMYIPGIDGIERLEELRRQSQERMHSFLTYRRVPVALWIQEIRVLLLKHYSEDMRMEDDGSRLVARLKETKWMFTQTDSGIRVEHSRHGSYKFVVDRTIPISRLRDWIETVLALEKKADKAASEREIIDSNVRAYYNGLDVTRIRSSRHRFGNGSRQWDTALSQVRSAMTHRYHGTLITSSEHDGNDHTIAVACNTTDGNTVTVRLYGSMRRIWSIGVLRVVRRETDGMRFEVSANADGMWGRFEDPCHWLDWFCRWHLDEPVQPFSAVWDDPIWKTGRSEDHRER